MKATLLLILLILTSCAKPKPEVVSMPRSVPGAIIASADVESVRYAENLKAYTVGRYVDPNNALAMHERHRIYRVETTAHWNLHPNTPARVPTGPVADIHEASFRPAPVTEEIAAEVQRQKAATQAVIAQGEKLQQTLGELSNAITVNQQIAEENAQLKEKLNMTARRLNALEESLREAQTKPEPPPVTELDVW